MDSEIIRHAGAILCDIIESKDAYDKIATILKVIPIESFDEAFRFFTGDDQKKLLDAMEKTIKINSIETLMIVDEFIRKNDLQRYLKTTTMNFEETLQAFQKYSSKHPRQISMMLAQTWLEVE
jgi:stalled ribosome rescue protein Dom34